MIDSKQFIITDNGYDQDNWCTITLSCGKKLSYHQDLAICHNQDYSIVLLGHAWSVLPAEEQLSPQEFVMQSNSQITEEEIIQEEKTWCGRYLLIANDYIYLDAIGLLGVYYHKEAISCSVNVLCQHLNIPIIFPDIKQGDIPPFLPGTMTGYENIIRLMPSQILNINTLMCHTRKLLPDAKIAENSLEQQIKAFSKTFVCSLNNMYDYLDNKNIMIALTGGRDSRALLAILSQTDIPYKLFSLEHKHISDGDVFIPPILAKAVNKHFLYVKREDTFDSKLHNDFRTHCAGFAYDEDWDFYSYKQYQCLTNETKKL